MERYNLYKKLKDTGYPQGGRGEWLIHPDTGEKVYIPLPSELYSQFIGDKKEWDIMTDTMAQCWIDNSKK